MWPYQKLRKSEYDIPDVAVSEVPYIPQYDICHVAVSEVPYIRV